MKLISSSSTHTPAARLKTLTDRYIGGKLVGYLQSVVNMTQGSPKTNPDSGQSEI